MLGTIIEQNGDGLLEQSHMPVGWPLHIDGAVRQSCAHRDTTLQELDDLLGEYDLKRDLVEINRKAPQWSHNAVWSTKYMEPKPGFTLQQLWADSESAIAQKTSPSYEVQDNDIRRAVMAISAVPAATLPDSAFLLALGTEPQRLFLLLVFVSVCLWRLRDSLLDCVRVLHQFTLEAPQSADGHLYALINKLTLFCNMQLNVLNDLAEAKALDGKKSRKATCSGKKK